MRIILFLLMAFFSSAVLADTISVPVLNHSISAGEIIKEDDISYIDVPEQKVHQRMVIDESQLVGKTPKRMIKADKPVLTHEIKIPIVMKKGALVTLVLRTPDMLLSTQAKALEDGTKGEAIRFMNTTSQKIIMATILSDNQAQIAQAPQNTPQIALSQEN